MTSLRRPLTALTGLALVLFVSACTVPGSLRVLTKEAGDSSIALSVALSNLEKRLREIAEARAASTARFASELARSDHSLARTIAMVEMYESPKAAADYKGLRKLLDEALTKVKPAGKTSKNVEKEIINKLESLDSDAKALRQVGVSLLKFSKEAGRFERVQFFAEFVNSVINDVKKARAAGDKAKKQANEAIEKAPQDIQDVKH